VLDGAADGVGTVFPQLASLTTLRAALTVIPALTLAITLIAGLSRQLRRVE
jgi:hypothetical protein